MSGWAQRHLELDAYCIAGCGQTSELQPSRWHIQELLEHWLRTSSSLFLAEKPGEQSHCSSLESLSPELLLLDLKPSQEQCVLGFITGPPPRKTLLTQDQFPLHAGCVLREPWETHLPVDVTEGFAEK